MARNGPPAMSDLSPLPGAKRTKCARSEYFAFDPYRTSRLQGGCWILADCPWLYGSRLKRPTPQSLRGVHAGKGRQYSSRPKFGLERNLESTRTVEIIATLAPKGTRDVGGERHVVPHRRHDAGRHPAVDVLRRAVRDGPIVDDHGRRRRAELDDTAIADEIVFREEIEIGVDNSSIDHERHSELRADAADQRQPTEIRFRTKP